MLPRPFYQKIWQELVDEKPMVFMPGPRQTGKTTLAQSIAKEYANHLYFNWDIPDHRIRLIGHPFFFEEIERRNGSKPLIIFDELHKYQDWKNYLKGVYDQFKDEFFFLISGSGRLDLYQKGGDSLAGRYYQFHLWPFTLAELSGIGGTVADFRKMPFEVNIERGRELEETWANLGKLSGFPEPFLTGRETSYRRWTNSYSRQLIREDIRDLTNIRDIANLETLYYLLPSKVGSPISISSLSGDLKIAYNTVRNWLSTLEQFFLIFSIPPWTRKIARAIQKERKIYLWDTPRIKDPAAKLENMVALELFRALTVWNDMGWGRFTLHFIKNKEKQEVDFLIADENVPLLLIETKLVDTQPSAALLKFQSALNVPAVQLTNRDGGYRLLTAGRQRILIAPCWQWVCALPW